MELTAEHILHHLRRFGQRDPELFDELQRRMAARPLPEVVAEARRKLSLPEDKPLVTERGVVTAHGQEVLETIVSSARPVFLIRDNRATVEFVGPESQVWAARAAAAQPVLDRVIPAVGRLEVNNNPDCTWLGTGWLVADDIIVTNRHVAREFGRRGDQGFVFRTGANGGPMASRVDFLEEYQRSGSLEFAVTSILWIASSDEPDVAFLRVVRTIGERPLPPQVALADTVAADELVATIGYPARDSRIPDQDLVRKIFGDVYEKKRLAPGQVKEVGPEELEHDCATLGGNSGSLVVSLRTGEAVGLHFAGVFMRANYAVPAPRIRELLQAVQRGELPGPITVGGGTPPPAAAPPLPTLAPGTYTLQVQIPVEITVKVGAAVFPGGTIPPISLPTATGDHLEGALRAARDALAGDPNVIEIRPGYRFKRGWITDERVIVVELRKKLSFAELRSAGQALIPSQFLGVGVDVRTAALADQLKPLGIDLEALEARARPGQYREPPDLSLDLVKEPMRAIFHVSPDAGFPNLRAFLGRVRQHLTATMYEWDPNHVSAALAAALTPAGRSLKMVTQKKGTEEAVADMCTRVGDKFEHVWASVGSGRLIPSAYHIKVASRDGEEVWLSSGNWKDSNQADIDPAGEHSTSLTPLREHNREWHAIIANAKLATMFQKYIEFDFAEAQRVPLEEGLEAVLPDLFVPEEAFLAGLERAVTARYFDPLVLDREVEIQPLLTPDRDSRGKRLFMACVREMIGKGTQKIYVENQSFNLLAENDDEFEEFFALLRDKQQAGVDVRIIFRDGREFGAGNGPKQQKLLERIKDFGLDTDCIRVQAKCHTKGIIVDTAEVLLGSHNLTNEGSLFNRDASLLVRDSEVAAYFENVFLFDWEVLAQQEADELVGGVRLAPPGEAPPRGFRRVSLAELLGQG